MQVRMKGRGRLKWWTRSKSQEEKNGNLEGGGLGGGGGKGINEGRKHHGFGWGMI